MIQKHKEYTTTYTTHTDWMVEEYIAGVELGVELIMSNGTCIFSSIMECEKTPPPIFQGLGRFYPSLLSSNQQEQVIKECIQAAQFLHLDNGVLDMDVKYESDQGRGALILEINTRLGGNSVGFMHTAVFGIELIEQVLLCACQLTTVTDVYHPKTNAAYAKMVLAQKQGILHTDMNSRIFTEKLKEALGDVSSLLTSARCTAVAGARVRGACEKDEIPTILGVVIAVGDSWAEAKRNVDLILPTATKVLNSYVLRFSEQANEEAA